MEKETAIKLMSVYKELGESLNQATQIISTVEDTKEQEDLRHPIGNLMGLVWTDLMSPIVKEYPDLDPDK